LYAVVVSMAKRVHRDLGTLGLALCALFIVAAATMAWPIARSAAGPYATDIAPIAVSLTATGCAAFAARRSRHDRAMRLTWCWLAAALVVRALADLSWAWIDLVQHRDPFPSVADIGYLLFFPALL